MIPCTVFFSEPNDLKASKKANYIHFVNVPRLGEKALIGGVLWRCYDIIHNTAFGVVEIYLERSIQK